MDFVIAVRSYDRPDIIMKKTYALLKSSELLDKTYIFVANQQEYERYRVNLEKDGFDLQRLVIGVKGCAAIARFISDYFPEGQRMLCLDDDLISTYLYDKATKKFCNGNPHFKKVIEECFTLIEEHNFGSFTFQLLTTNCPNGLTARANSRISFKNNFLPGSFFGCHNNRERLHIDDMDTQIEDCIRTIKFFNAYGGVMMNHHFSVKNTSIGIEEGGLQTSGERGTDLTRYKNTLDSCNRIFEYDFTKGYIHKIFFNEKMNMNVLKFKNIIGFKKALQSKNIPIRVIYID